MLTNPVHRTAKRLFSLSIILLVFTSTTTSPTLAQDSRACVTAKDPVQLTYFYKPPTNTSLSTVISNFDFYVLTKRDEDEMRAIKSRGEGPVLQYITWDAIHDPCFQAKKPKGSPCSCSRQPNNNNVGWSATDVCSIRNNNPDWFLRGKDGELIYYRDYVIMDQGKSGWRNFFLDRMKQSQSHGWDGVFLDNLTTRFGAHSGTPYPLRDYPTYDSYRNSTASFLSYIRTNYFKPNGKLMFGNVSVQWGDNATYFNYMNHLDGAMDEFWAYPRTGYYSLKSWEADLNRARETINRGDSILLISQGYQADLSRQRFGIASYLLIASDKVYFRYTSDSSYRSVWLYENYRMKLGEPLGGYTRSGNTWTRLFKNGKVSVNPETRWSNIVLYTNC